MATREKKTPAWLVERLAAGELDAAVAADVRRRLLEEDRSPEEELAALDRSNREILAAHPEAGVAAEVRRRARAQERERQHARPRRSLVLGGALVAAGALVLVLIPRPRPHDPVVADNGPEITTPKGPERRLNMYVYRHDTDGDRPLPDGSVAARGDLLQLAYVTPTRVFGVLLSIDGAGKVTQHWPEPGAPRAAPLSPGGEVRLPSSYELDDAPGFERFFLITSPQPFEVAPILRAARTLAAEPRSARKAPLALPTDFGQAWLALDKPRTASSKETP